MRPLKTTQESVTDRLGWSPKEAAARIGCSSGLIKKLIREGKLPARHINRRVIILENDLRAILGMTDPEK